MATRMPHPIDLADLLNACRLVDILCMERVRFDPSSDTSCPVYPVLALAHASPSVFVIRLMYIDVRPLGP